MNGTEWETHKLNTIHTQRVENNDVRVKIVHQERKRREGERKLFNASAAGAASYVLLQII